MRVTARLAVPLNRSRGQVLPLRAAKMTMGESGACGDKCQIVAIR